MDFDIKEWEQDSPYFSPPVYNDTNRRIQSKSCHSRTGTVPSCSLRNWYTSKRSDSSDTSQHRSSVKIPYLMKDPVEPNFCITGRHLRPFRSRIPEKPRNIIVKVSPTPRQIYDKAYSPRNLSIVEPKLLRFSLKNRRSYKKHKSLSISRRSPIIKTDYPKQQSRLLNYIRIEK